ncbi:ABC-three component system middle component 2 [Microbacterium sp. 1P10UB]|uniref:ABC-three component system middle component 2 n=1 Tax=unclassified Microbacterium TaxID=2609290 RepID=UPI0039A0A1CC
MTRSHLPHPSDLESEMLEAAVAPEDHTTFRLVQLALLLDEISPVDSKGLGLERLGYYDFFAASPFAILTEQDLSERARLHRAAFDEHQLSYASTGSRFANRRRRLQHDVALLVAYGLVSPRGGGYGITEAGERFVGSLTALYADQYRESVRVVHTRFKRLSDTQLANAARHWLQTPSLLLDLYGTTEDSVRQPSASQSPVASTPTEPHNDDV